MIPKFKVGDLIEGASPTDMTGGAMLVVGHFGYFPDLSDEEEEQGNAWYSLLADEKVETFPARFIDERSRKLNDDV